MIVATKNVDALLRGLVVQDNLMISRVETIETAIRLDPNISDPKKELFVISNDDLKNTKARRSFMESLRQKHPMCIVMYINKIGHEYPDVDVDMFDSYLSKPKKDDVKAEFIKLVEAIEAKAKLNIGDDLGSPAAYKPKEAVFVSNTNAEEEVDEPVVTLDISDVKAPVEEKIEDSELGLLEAIKRSENWAALSVIAGEVNAARIVQEVTEANASFRQSETYVTALSENVTAILSNPEYDVQTQLSKVRAILHDRSYVKAKNNSVLEQCVEEIIMALVDRAKEEVLKKTAELDEKILYAFRNKDSAEAPNVRLATIIENRSKLLIDLTSLDVEIKGMSTVCNNTVNETVEGVISSSVSSTGSPILDSQMKSRFGDIVPENLIVVLDHLFQTGVESNEEFGKMSQAVNSTLRKLYELLSLYKEENEVLANTIRYLKANNVEDTVVANTIMKKSSRLFVSNGDFDSVALSYIVAKHNSRKNNNVLLLDVSGSDVFSMFGIPTMKFSNFMEKDKMDGKLLVVSTYDDTGIVLGTPEGCQRLSTRLLHYAKHYSMINILCTPEQSMVLESFKNDVISITYLVDCYPNTVRKMAECITATKVDNTASRLVLVNYVSDSSKLCKDLGVLERLDMQLVSCAPISAIRYCSLHTQDPYDVESILSDCEDVLNIC